MGYYSEVGCRLAIKKENAATFFAGLLKIYNQEYDIDKEFAPEIDATQIVDSLQKASDICSEFYFKAGEFVYWNAIYNEIHSIFDPEMPDIFIVELKLPSVKWYPNFPMVQFWENLLDNDAENGIVEWSFCRIGEEIEDIEFRDSGCCNYIEPLYPVTSIDWGE